MGKCYNKCRLIYIDSKEISFVHIFVLLDRKLKALGFKVNNLINEIV